MFKKIRYEIGWRISASCVKLMIFIGEKSKNISHKISAAKQMLKIVNEHPEVDKLLRKEAGIDLAVKANSLLKECCDILLDGMK